MKRHKLFIVFVVFIFLMSLSACAPSGYVSHESGFFSGFWHGFIFIFSLIGKLFGADIGIYADHNTGFTYWLGFIIGIGGFGGGGLSTRR